MNRYKVPLENLSKPQLLELAHYVGAPVGSDIRKSDIITELLQYNKVKKVYA